MGLSRAFSPKFLQKLSLTVSNRTTQQDEQLPVHSHKQTDICTLLIFGASHWYRHYFWWNHWQKSYSIMGAPAARTCCPGKAAWGEEAELWSTAVIPLGGKDAVSTTRSRVMTRLTGASAKGRSAAVRGHRRAEGRIGIHCILARCKHTHTIRAD